jgi:hypothetical protein
MVKRLLALLIAGAAATVSAAPGWKLDRKSVALGEAVTLTLTARPGTLERLDLAPLARSFEILNRNLGRDAREETLTLTLHPLQSGRLDLALPGVPGRAALDVADGSKDTPRVRFRVEIVPAEYHARQPVRLTLEACDDGGLQWNRPPLPTREGLLVRALGEDQDDVERDGERCTAHRWHWALTPTAAGANTLTLPMLEANKLGRRLRFPPPQLHLQARPVPAWLPAEAAVGKPSVAAAALPADWPVERPLAWRIEVQGAYSADALRKLMSLQTANQPQLRAYPPTVEPMPGGNAVPRHALTLYLLAHERGAATLPDLAFPWYDTASGRIEQARLPGPSLEIVDPARQRLLTALAVLAALAAAAALGFLGQRRLGWRWRRRVASADFSQATDVADLARRIRAFSLRAGVSPAPTLGAWRDRMERQASAEGMAHLVTALEQARYGTTPAELAVLKRQACDCLLSMRLRQGR